MLEAGLGSKTVEKVVRMLSGCSVADARSLTTDKARAAVQTFRRIAPNLAESRLPVLASEISERLGQPGLEQWLSTELGAIQGTEFPGS